MLDFNAVGVERVIPLIEVKNTHLMRLYNNKGRVYRPMDGVGYQPQSNSGEKSPKTTFKRRKRSNFIQEKTTQTKKSVH